MVHQIISQKQSDQTCRIQSLSLKTRIQVTNDLHLLLKSYAKNKQLEKQPEKAICGT